jgi:APA family basic amino acid/polyamine antiporter
MKTIEVHGPSGPTPGVRRLIQAVLRVKSIEQSLHDAAEPGTHLARRLRLLDLLVFGVGVTVGTGIFVLTGVVAATRAGPAIALSFVLAALACALAALCHAELAITVPVAGSAYTYTYATLGELAAWIVGWDLILELSVAAAAVAIGWSQYAGVLLTAIGLPLPSAIAGGPGAIVDLPAALIALALTGVAVRGIQFSSRLTLVVTTIKLGVVLLFIVVGLSSLQPANWSPFIPPPAPISTAEGTGGPLDVTLLQALMGGGGQPIASGVQGIVAGAAIIFFAYIGFAVVATTAEETRHPQRDLPLGILGSLVIATLFYVVVSLVMTGMVPYRLLNTASPMATALIAVGRPQVAALVSVGAIAGLTTVIMVLLLGQARVLFAMSRDALLPSGALQSSAELSENGGRQGGEGSGGETEASGRDGGSVGRGCGRGVERAGGVAVGAPEGDAERD